jgi:hypothetical protein
MRWIPCSHLQGPSRIRRPSTSGVLEDLFGREWHEIRVWISKHVPALGKREPPTRGVRCALWLGFS